MNDPKSTHLQERNFRLLLITFLGIFSLTMFSVSICSHYLIKKIIYQNATEILNQFRYSFEDKLNSGVTLAIQANEDMSIEQLTSYRSLDYATQNNGMKQLASYITVCEEIDSIYVYNGLQNKFYLSSAVPGNDNLIVQMENFADKEVIDYIEQFHNYPSYTLIPRQAAFAEGITKNYYTIIGYDPYLNVTQNGSLAKAVVVNLSVDYMSQLTSAGSIDGELLIVDENGHAISNSERFPMLTDLSEEGFMKNSLSTDDFVYGIVQLDDGKYFLTQTAPNDYGWRYYWLLPYGKITQQVNRLWILVAVLGFVLTGLSFGIITRLSHSINEPIGHIQNDLERTRTDLSAAETAQRESYFQLRQDFLNDLITAEKMHVSKRFSQQAQKFDFAFPFCMGYRLLLFRILNSKGFAHENSVEEQDAVLYALMNLITELCRDFQIECVRLRNTFQIVVLLASEDQKELSNQNIQLLFENISGHVEKILSLTLCCSASDPGSRQSELPQLYGQVQETDLYHLVSPHSKVLFFSDFAPRDCSDYIYPEQSEKKLIDYLNKGDFERAKKCYLEIVDDVSSCSYQNIHIALTRLSLAINILLNKKKSSGIPSVKQQSTFSLSLADMEHIDQVNAQFFEVISRICDISIQKHSERQQKLVEQVDELIQQNFSDSTLCIDSIASEIGLSADYLSRIYRQQTGATILDTIIDTRMEYARNMLRTTSATIQNIAASVGYVNLSYFYKLFKKENGITPAEYRDRKK